MEEQRALISWLLQQGRECEWVEFKVNNLGEEEMGENISALSNSACLHKQPFGYMVFGVDNTAIEIVGTRFNIHTAKRGNEELENWLVTRLSPRIDFRVTMNTISDKNIVIFEIPAARSQPVRFQNVAFIRIGSYTRKLLDFPEKERKIWNAKPHTAFAMEIAADRVTPADIVDLLDTQTFFEQLLIPYPSYRGAVMEKLLNERMVVEAKGNYHITNLGALLYAKKITNFPTVARKAPRVIIYESTDKLKTKRDVPGVKGYAVAFEGMVNFINGQLPANEEISNVIRETVTMYPADAVREIVANALIHQDFSESGTGPMIEIFSDRMEITNPGLPLITPARFIDEYLSRNEELASFMRRIGICEEKGSGIDRVIFLAEHYQLPAPQFRELEKHTQVILYAYKSLNEMDREDKIRACYQHCCLKYVARNHMTNQSLRGRFKIEDQNSAIASRIIAETLEARLIKLEDPDNKSKKYTRYIPFWG